MTIHIRAKSIVRDLDAFRIGPISFDLEPGLIYALVGPNGSGKTTLFRMLMGLVQPGSGSVERFGAPLDVDDIAQLQRISYVPEALVGHDAWSVQEINDIYRRTYPGFDPRMLQTYQSDVDVHKQFSKLSKGMQRRAMLGAAMATGSDVLLLDEPTDGIDPFARQDVLGHLATFMENENRTVLMATHNLEDVRRVADVVIVIENGEHIGTWEKDELLEGWQKLWLASEPAATLRGEQQRRHGAGVELVTNNLSATREDLANQDIEVVNMQAVDMVEALRIAIHHRGGRASPVQEV